MIIQALTLIALAVAAPARADVSDSGNLTIGGQGVIQGTMTVQGAGFSVGGTTFSVAGGSITLGGRLNAAAAGIKWADGTTSTTASAGGSAAVSVSTRTVYLTSSGTYTTPANVRQIRISMIGGGGGGGGSETNAGSAGGDTSFNSIVAKGGSGGTSTGAAGTGGTGGSGTASRRIAGSVSPRATGIFTNINGAAGPANSGIGGEAGCYWSGARAGGGGGNGEYVELIINSPGSSYSYAVGAGGAGGTASNNGGAGGSGIIIIDGFY